jgi:hypothetical protein
LWSNCGARASHNWATLGVGGCSPSAGLDLCHTPLLEPTTHPPQKSTKRIGFILFNILVVIAFIVWLVHSPEREESEQIRM